MRTFHENFLAKQGMCPQSLSGATTEPTTYIDMTDYERLVFVIRSGAIAGGRTLDAKLVQASDSAGSDSKDITGAAIVQIDDTEDVAMTTIEVRDTALDVANGFRYVSMTITASAAIIVSVTAYLYKGGGLPPTQDAFYSQHVEVS